MLECACRAVIFYGLCVLCLLNRIYYPLAPPAYEALPTSRQFFSETRHEAVRASDALFWCPLKGTESSQCLTDVRQDMKRVHRSSNLPLNGRCVVDYDGLLFQMSTNAYLRRYSVAVCRRPRWVVSLCFAVTFACSLGVFKVKVITNPDLIWVSPLPSSTTWATKHPSTAQCEQSTSGYFLGQRIDSTSSYVEGATHSVTTEWLLFLLYHR